MAGGGGGGQQRRRAGNRCVCKSPEDPAAAARGWEAQVGGRTRSHCRGGTGESRNRSEASILSVRQDTKGEN